jgi:hypothetical protein
MRRIFAAAALVLLPASASGAPQEARPERPSPLADARQCVDTEMRYADEKDGGTPKARTLDTLPPADLHLAVQRDVDGCIEPVVVRQNVGGTAPGAPSHDLPRSTKAGVPQPL